MALAKKYKVNIDHQFGGKSRYVDIYCEGWGGSQSELTGTMEPGILDYPGSDNTIFDPIFGSELNVNVWNLSAEQLIEFASARNRDYLAILVNDDDTIDEWMGWLLPGEVEEPWNQAPYETNLVFNCGLGLLDDDFLDTDGSYYTGRASLKDIIIDCLQKIYPSTVSGITRPPLRSHISLLESTQSLVLSTSALSQYLNRNKYVNEDGTVWTCQEVLRDILGVFKARIQMGAGGWHITRLRDYALLYDSYNMPFQEWDADGTYSTSGSDNDTKTMTGPQARSSMVGWIEGSQRVRWERAFKAIRLKQDYGYRSLFMLGQFNSENWDDFWSTGGSPSREQSAENENEYHINLGSSMQTAYIEQTINDLTWTVGDTIPRFIFSFEAMADYADSSSYTLIRFAVRFTYDADAPSSNYYLDGQIGGTADDPNWQTVSILNFYFTTEDGLPVSRQWYKFELALPAITGGVTGNLEIRLYEGLVSGSGTFNSWNVRNAKLMPTYDLTPPEKMRTLQLDISDQNLETMPVEEIGLGDVDVDNNEGQLFFNTLTTDSSGETPTEVWRSTRISGASRVAVGPEQPLLEYIQGGYAIQNGLIRKRLSGRMVMDDSDWAMNAILEDSIYYIFTRLTIDLKRGECDVSMVELPESGDMTDNLVTEWTNRIGTGFDTFNSSGDLITSLETDGTGQGADANSISYEAYEQFRIRVDTSSISALAFRIDFAGNQVTLASNTDTIITAPSSAGSDVPELESVMSSGSATGLTIWITKVYGQ
jgi:hypothetical protein